MIVYELHRNKHFSIVDYLGESRNRSHKSYSARYMISPSGRLTKLFGFENVLEASGE